MNNGHANMFGAQELNDLILLEDSVCLDSERIAQFHGSQCGFCTPGIVVACHATLLRAAERGVKPTPDDLQTGLDGNLCRCTGYRPILDACKVELTDLFRG